MEFHEYANLFPMMGEVELDQLAESIRQHGQQFPVVIYEGKILDGRNRYRACEKLGFSPDTADFAGADPLAFAVASNLDRRHLSDSQRAMISARLGNLKAGRPWDLNPPIDGIKSARTTREEAAAQMKVGTASYDRAKRVQRCGIPELVEAVDAGKVSVNAAYLVSTLSADEQRELMGQGPEAVKAKSTELRTSAAKVAKPEEKEAPPLVVDGTAPRKVLPCVPNDADELWLLARIQLEKIHRTDIRREEVLKLVVQYANERLEMKR